MLVNPSEERLHHLTTQLKWRVLEGSGEAIYAIGVEDDGTCKGISEQDLVSSLETLKEMSERAGCDMAMVRKQQGKEGWCAEVMVRQKPMDGHFIDMRIAVVGNVDSGKSTIVGVLTSGKLDNGRGLARSSVFRHRHELESGRTSSITQHIMGINASGDIVNYSSIHAKTSSEIVKESAKVVTFIDLAGHERYIKTTVYGMTGCVPDYTMVVVGANMGVQRMTKEHLGVALALKCPTYFVVTKVDMCPDNVLQGTVNELSKIVKAPGIRKMPLIVKSEKDVMTCAKSMASDARIAPIFLVSSVTGQSLELLRLFLNIIPAQKTKGLDVKAPAEFHIDDTFYVSGVGTVVAGTMLRGTLSTRSNLLLGPDNKGQFHPIQLKSIMNKSMPVNQVSAGQSATLAIKKVKRNQIRKGMVVVDAKLNPQACQRFTAEVMVLHHPTTIGINYQPVVHSLTVRQACKVVSLDRECIRTGDRALVTFEFLFRPEYLLVGARLIFREGRTKGIGRIMHLHYPDGTSVSVDDQENSSESMQ
mmetsp:Transcript_43557/g.137820  ORF Transcript_43557/g.137820 Transcript_43557/m.137820 type:complete len:531 (-) Transcript_43557:220-1812(-)